METRAPDFGSGSLFLVRRPEPACGCSRPQQQGGMAGMVAWLRGH
ncbi:hypothetical protein [Salibacterium halotolerans]|nr:hypothetical protein [Salibacterium halotolerans]